MVCTVTQPQTELINQISKHLASALDACNLSNKPFSNFYVRNCFPDLIYKDIIANLPNSVFYKPLSHRDSLRKDGTCSRFYFDLSDENFSLLPDQQRVFWGSISKALCSPVVKQAVFNQLKFDLARRFDISTQEVNQIEAYPIPGLFRDMEGYKILPHPDTPEKIVTVQFYFPTDPSQANFGTSIYRRKTRLQAKLEKLIGLPSRNKFQHVKTFEFMPNTGYGFAVSEKSWHGRSQLPNTGDARNTLMLIYYNKPGLGYMNDKTLKRSHTH
ncbi:MAG: hypothetical protein QNJ46_27680 [Leptolyngbyaceae cyanobacterium MO_188.B28]|nr:hypothetical protein [Leptolyngbyaceae cyanobacterium MO_188.B28]